MSENEIPTGGENEPAVESEAETQDTPIDDVNPDEPAAIDDDGEPGGDADAEPEVELREFDFGGNKFAVPKDAVPEELAVEIEKFTKGIWADYTRKSQDVAERTRALEAEKTAVEKLSQLNGDALLAFSRGLQLKQEIEQLQRVNLDQLWQSDPDRARRVSDQLALKQAEFQRTIHDVQTKEAELSSAQMQEMQRQMEEGRKHVERYVKGFEQKVPEVVEYVTKTYGMTKEQAESWPLNPATAAMAYKAMMYDRMQASASKKPAGKPAQSVKPVVPQKGAGGNAVKDAARGSVEDMKRLLGLPT
jgi:hypothetical protein